MEQHYSRRSRKAHAVVAWLLIMAMLATVVGVGCHGGGGVGPGPDPLGGAGFGAASWIIEQIGAGIIAYITGESAGWLLSFVGGDDSSQALADAVDQMNQKLDQVIAELAVIEQELEAIMKLIQISTDEIKNIEQQFLIAEPQNIINNTYDNMKGVFTSDEIGTPAGKAASQDTTADILSTARTNIDQQMFDIHAGIMGATPGIGNGAMDAFTTTLVDHTGDGQLLNRYKALESYFERLVTVQSKGLSLMVEALHARDSQQASPGGVSSSDYQGTAKQWMDDKFTPYMEDEIEEFLRCTARLVVAECDLRTDAAAIGPFLPADAAEIFKRADFIAAQIAPGRHGFGAVVRVIGEPDTVKSIIADYQVKANGQPMDVVKLGLDKQNVKETTVEVWNHWPGGYTRAYMQWNWDTSHGVSSFIKFNAATTVAVAKVCLPTAANSTTYDVNTTFPHETASGSLKTCKCDGDMKCVSGAAAVRTAAQSDETHIYGHATLPIRHRPHEWYQYKKYEEHDDRLTPTADTRLTGSYPWARSRVDVNENIHWYNSWADFHIESGIALPLINGDDGRRRMTARTEIRSHRYGSLDLSVDSHSWLHIWWTGSSGEHNEWESSGGDPHIYGEVSPHRYFDAGEAHSLYIKSWMIGSGKGLKGECYGLRVWPHYLYLFY
jgi:hypothetical protein